MRVFGKCHVIVTTIRLDEVSPLDNQSDVIEVFHLNGCSEMQILPLCI